VNRATTPDVALAAAVRHRGGAGSAQQIRRGGKAGASTAGGGHVFLQSAAGL